MKKFDSLTNTEYFTVLDRNPDFKKQIRDMADESSALYIEDILRCFPCYSIEECIGETCTVEVLNQDDFLHGLLAAQKAFGILYAEDAEMAERAIQGRGNRNAIVAELAEAFRAQLQAEYDYYEDDNCLHEYFVDCFLGNDPETQDWTVDDDYILYTNN